MNRRGTVIIETIVIVAALGIAAAQVDDLFRLAASYN
jgi:hypothetical protein